MITSYFSFGHGQLHPITGEHMLGYYITVIAEQRVNARETMFNSVFGVKWCMEYNDKPNEKFFPKGNYCTVDTSNKEQLQNFLLTGNTNETQQTNQDTS